MIKIWHPNKISDKCSSVNKKGTQSILYSIICLLCTLVVMVAPAMAQTAKTKPIKVQVPSQMPVSHPVTTVMDQFCKTVNQRSAGRLVLSHFPSGQLLTDKEIPKAVSRGTIKIAQTFLAWWTGMIPDVFPSGAKQVQSYAHYRRLADGPLGDYWTQRLAEKGKSKVIAPLLYSTMSGYILNREVKTPGDMQGLKIRIPTRVLAAEVRALGGTPVVLSSADVYMALHRGTIQGAVSGIGSFYARKWYEVAKHIFLPRPMPSEFHIVSNLEWFNSLPPDLQKIIMEAGQEASASCEVMVRKIENKIKAGLETKGVTITEISHVQYQSKFAPMLEPAFRASAVKEFGLVLADQWDVWIEQTR